MSFFLLALFVAVLVVVIGGIGVWSNIKRGAVEGDALEAAKLSSLSTVEGFTPTVIYEGQRGSYGLAIDPVTQKFTFAIPGAQPRIYHFSQLIAVEIDRDGNTITTTTGKVSTGEAAVAAAIGGPVAGLLVGAKTSSISIATETVNLTLKVYVDDIYTPCFAIPFGRGTKGRFGADMFLVRASEQIDAWFGRFRAILVSLEGLRSAGPNPDAIEYSAPAPAPTAMNWVARSFTA